MKPERRTFTVHVPLKFIARGGRKTIVSQANGVASRKAPDGCDMAAVALARAFRWKAMLEDGRYSSIEELARMEKVKTSYVYQLLRLTLLSPHLIEAALDGNLHCPVAMLRKPIPLQWDVQFHFLMSNVSTQS